MRKMFGKLLAAAVLAVAAGAGAPATANPALTSNVLGAGMYEPVVITTQSGDVFDLQSVDLALGPFNPASLHDTVTLTGFFADSHQDTLTLDLRHGFETQAINWTGLTSVSFGPLSEILDSFGDPLTRYMAFDNISYTTGSGGAATSDFEDLAAGFGYPNGLESGGLHYGLWFGVIYGPDAALDFPTQVPEPAAWAMMLLGFFGVGTALRGTRRKAALA